jgi:hypothetical protein
VDAEFALFFRTEGLSQLFVRHHRMGILQGWVDSVRATR